MLGNQYGHFEDRGRVFVVERPDPPMPWSNVICNGRYGLIVTHNGGGFSWYDDAQHNVLTRWEMDLVRDVSGKHLYLADLDDNTVWTLAPGPVRPGYDRYRCTHRPGATTFETSYAGIDATWTLTVTPDDPVELWRVTLANHGGKPRRLRIASWFEWCCGVAPDSKREFHRLFFGTHHDSQRNAIIATRNMWPIPEKSEKDHWNTPWPYAAAHAVCGIEFDSRVAIADKSSFLGRYGTPVRPAAMLGAAHDGLGFGRFGDAAAALGGDLLLKPGETVTLHYLLAIDSDVEAVTRLIDTYKSPAAAEAAVRSGEEFWTKTLDAVSVRSKRDDFDLLNNHWLPYQAISGRLWGRTGLYQQSGARGFRDQLQDSQVWLALDPRHTRDQILLHATRQFVDGSVNHWWHALADFGSHTACSDDYLWLPLFTAIYIRETGDLSILKAKTPFMDDPTEATLKEHCHRSIRRAMERTSPRGIPHIGSCDWNDGLSAMGVEEKGESVWVGMFLASILEDFAQVLELDGDAAKAREYREHSKKYAAAVNEHGWDGGWYRYGTKDSGEWVGSKQSPEGKIHLNPQTWAILTGIAPRERAEQAWAAVKEHLLSPYGPLLLAPAYTQPDPDIGYITRYSPGSRENGGVYMHAATWALAAACKRREQDTVERIWNSVSPPVRGRDAEAYWAEPYVTPGNVDGPLSDKPGRAGWTWYTGSAAWLNRVSLEWMLGIRPEWEGLRIDPVPPRSLGNVDVTRRYRGVRVRVRFDAAHYEPDIAPELKVNGERIKGCVLAPEMVSKAADSGRGVVEVEVRWPAGAAAGEVEAKGEREPRRIGS